MNSDAELAILGRDIIPPIKQRLIKQRDIIQQQLDQVNAAIQVLDENPTFEKVYDTLSKVTHL